MVICNLLVAAYIGFQFGPTLGFCIHVGLLAIVHLHCNLGHLQANLVWHFKV
jgi:hypothetical protein